MNLPNIGCQIEPKPFGVLLLCTGKRGNLIRNCLKSLQATNPSLPFHLLADRPYDVPFQWVESCTGQASRRIKTQLYKYSPFDVTLFVDDDTIFQKPLNLKKLIGKADFAIGVDTICEKLKNCWKIGVYQELEETISICGESYPFYNSGVMLWRNSAAVHAFFDKWHKEWLKYQKNDQYAFARALKSTDLNLKVLPKSYNSGVKTERYVGVRVARYVRNSHIHHLQVRLSEKESTGRLFNLMNPMAAGTFETAFVRAVNSGLMAENQYQYIARDLHDNEKCSLLIISNGPDYDLWDQATKGNLLYVQGNPGYHFTSQNNPVHYRFGGRVGHWVSVPVPPDNINKPWDFVIVDAPVGHNKSCPGRQIPIAWASQLAQKAIFVHDYERPWERKVCDRYLGTPSRIIDSKGLNNHQLAVFRLKKQASCATTTLSTQSSQGQPVNSLSCPICETSTAIFLPHGLNRRKNASCPNCFALERHRLAWLFFCRHTDLFKSLPKRFLHFAPESCLARKLQATPGLSYISADLDPELAMLQMDITKINFPDAHFDVIYCSHVLEHVADDRAAMRELRRVLTPAGWAIFMVPIRATATFEDPQIVNPSDRLKAFGQCDHVRKYGPDFQDRLREAGFKVNRVCPSSVVTETEMRMMAINPCDDIFYCTK